MIYYSTRIIILILLWIGVALKYRLRNKYMLSATKNKLWVLFYFVTISSVLFNLMLLVSVESSFMRFGTVEEAFAYSNVGYKIDKIIDGKGCAFIVYTSSGVQHVDYLNKDGNQWLMVKRILYRNEKLSGDDTYTVWFLEDPSTKQLLVLVIQDFPDSSIKLDQAIISDNMNSNFERFQIVYEKQNLKSYYYYYVVDLSSINDYEVIIDRSSFSYRK